VEALPHIHQFFFAHSITLRGLPLSAPSRCITCQDDCVQQSHAAKYLLPLLKVNL